MIRKIALKIEIPYRRREWTPNWRNKGISHPHHSIEIWKLNIKVLVPPSHPQINTLRTNPHPKKMEAQFSPIQPNDRSGNIIIQLNSQHYLGYQPLQQNFSNSVHVNYSFAAYNKHVNPNYVNKFISACYTKLFRIIFQNSTSCLVSTVNGFQKETTLW